MKNYSVLGTIILLFTLSFQASAWHVVDENNRLYVYSDKPLNIVGSVSKSGNMKGFKKLVKKAKKIEDETANEDEEDERK